MDDCGQNEVTRGRLVLRPTFPPGVIQHNALIILFLTVVGVGLVFQASPGLKQSISAAFSSCVSAINEAEKSND